MSDPAQNSLLKDAEAFRSQLIVLCKKNAEGLTGPEVVGALISITDDLYDGTIDEAYDNTEFENRDIIAVLWDTIWLSSFARRLLSIKNKK